YSWLQSSSNVGGGTNGKRKQCPLLFDDDYKAKPAYWAFVDPTMLSAKNNPTPEPTQEPEPTKAPEVTEPEVTEAPTVTEAPKATEVPEVEQVDGEVMSVSPHMLIGVGVTAGVALLALVGGILLSKKKKGSEAVEVKAEEPGTEEQTTEE
ncbi:MAG: hypothetical protein J6A45_01130, partial [Lachnospiraceae bacterium]|nr:hypothetical protein [Lachnospiraceae bacterium]